MRIRAEGVRAAARIAVALLVAGCARDMVSPEVDKDLSSNLQPSRTSTFQWGGKTIVVGSQFYLSAGGPAPASRTVTIRTYITCAGCSSADQLTAYFCIKGPGTNGPQTCSHVVDGYGSLAHVFNSYAGVTGPAADFVVTGSAIVWVTGSPSPAIGFTDYGVL